MMRFFFLCLMILSAAPASAAEKDNIVKDSIYFTLDDGVMSKEEMREEAEYVYGRCTNHLYQKLYFNCECIAGAFLRERETRGPLALQNTILTELFRGGGKTAECANKPSIAGDVYTDCMDFAAYYRRLENNNEAYCQCTANRVANDFSDFPYLRTAYIERLRVNAMLSCERRFPTVHQSY